MCSQDLYSEEAVFCVADYFIAFNYTRKPFSAVLGALYVCMHVNGHLYSTVQELHMGDN